MTLQNTQAPFAEQCHTKQNKRVYINLRPLWKEEHAFFKMCLSDRSDGKTTGAKCIALDEFFQSGKCPVFCRRFGTEIEVGDFLNEFAKDIYNVKPALLEGYHARAQGSRKKGWHFDISGNGKEWTRAIHILPLSMAGRLKSSLFYETNRHVFIDEYIPLDDRYIKNEVTSILELYKTIDREHYESKILITGNKVTRYNPVFEYFHINDFKKGFNYFNHDRLCLYIYSNKGNQKIAETNPMAELTEGTEYAGYNTGEFLTDFSDMLERKFYKSMPLAGISHNKKTYGIYFGTDCLVICPTNGDTPAPVLCIDRNNKNAIWLNLAEKIRLVLQSYKFTSRLKFTDEITLHELEDFYKKI